MEYNHYIEAGEAEPSEVQELHLLQKPFMVNKWKHLYTMRYNIILYTGKMVWLVPHHMGRHGTTETFIYLEVQYNIEDKKALVATHSTGS